MTVLFACFEIYLNFALQRLFFVNWKKKNVAWFSYFHPISKIAVTRRDWYILSSPVRVSRLKFSGRRVSHSMELGSDKATELSVIRKLSSEKATELSSIGELSVLIYSEFSSYHFDFIASRFPKGGTWLLSGVKFVHLNIGTLR